MFKNLKKKILIIMALSVLVGPALVPAAAYAATGADQIKTGLCAGASLDVTQATGCAPDPTAPGRINSIITTVINIFSLVVGVLAVIFIIIGGLKYITSGGEASNISGAKNTILFAIVGLVVVAFAQIVVHYVLAKVAGP